MSLASLHLDEGISHEGVLRRSALFVFALAAVVAGLVGWASFASVDKVVRAEGRIIPSTKSQVIQHLEGGIVAAISVKEGDYVHRDQVLASIDPTRVDATLAERKSKRVELQARAARLSAEAEGAASLRLPPGLTNATPQVRSELDAFTSRRDRVLQEQRVLREQVQQRRAELVEQESRARSLTGEAEVARRQLALVQQLIQRQAASQLEVLDAQARLQRIETQISEAQSAGPKLLAAISETEERTREIAARLRAEARTELANVNGELQRVEQEIRGESDRVARTELRAPVDGVVNRVYVNTVGGVLRPGEPIFELTPVDGKVVVEARVRPADRAELHEGVAANVRISAFDSVRHGVMRGRVTEVSADTVPDDKGDRLFRVKVEVDATDSPIPIDRLSAGMTATADLVTGRRTVLEYLVSPLHRFGSRALTEPR
ncbi:MAG: HlyD family type I secretion periplasmic adaptor subunit [Burkholderiales bacterium]|nr:HlyD family type I secretion periplasmic adaptor subunit [Burkholderiales bacterium]